MKSRIIRTCPYLAALVGLALMGGCADLSVLEPTSDTARFYYLQEEQGAFTGDSGISVIVGPGSIARYLDHPGIATFPDANVLAYSSGNRWAEPLDSGIARFVASVLSAELESSNVGTQREMPGMPADYRVGFHVHHLGGQPGGRVQLQVSWWIEDREGSRKPFEGSTFTAQPRDGERFDSYVETIREALRAWAVKVAREIESLRQS